MKIYPKNNFNKFLNIYTKIYKAARMEHKYSFQMIIKFLYEKYHKKPEKEGYQYYNDFFIAPL